MISTNDIPKASPKQKPKIIFLGLLGETGAIGYLGWERTLTLLFVISFEDVSINSSIISIDNL